MHVVVCTKETPDTATRVEVDAGGNVTWGDTPVVLNPWDEYTVEEGLRVVEAREGTCTVLAMGSDQTRGALKHAVAMGCDEAILVSDPALAVADTLVTSHVLARAIEKLGDVDLAIFGKQAIDGDTGQTAVQVGRRLGWSTLIMSSRLSSLTWKPAPSRSSGCWKRASKSANRPCPPSSAPSKTSTSRATHPSSASARPPGWKCRCGAQPTSA